MNPYNSDLKRGNMVLFRLRFSWQVIKGKIIAVDTSSSDRTRTKKVYVEYYVRYDNTRELFTDNAWVRPRRIFHAAPPLDSPRKK